MSLQNAAIFRHRILSKGQEDSVSGPLGSVPAVRQVKCVNAVELQGAAARYGKRSLPRADSEDRPPSGGNRGMRPRADHRRRWWPCGRVSGRSGMPYSTTALSEALEYARKTYSFQ